MCWHHMSKTNAIHLQGAELHLLGYKMKCSDECQPRVTARKLVTEHVPVTDTFWLVNIDSRSCIVML